MRRIAMGFRSQLHRSNPLLSFNIALLYLLRMRPSPQAGRGPSYEPHPLVHTYGAWWLCEVLLAPIDGKLHWTNILFFIPLLLTFKHSGGEGQGTQRSWSNKTYGRSAVECVTRDKRRGHRVCGALAICIFVGIEVYSGQITHAEFWSTQQKRSKKKPTITPNYVFYTFIA